MAEHIRAGESRREISADLDDCQQDPDERGVRPVLSSLVKQFETQALLSFPSVIHEIEIWRAAVLMLSRYLATPRPIASGIPWSFARRASLGALRRS